jgi:hypothetical protein
MAANKGGTNKDGLEPGQQVDFETIQRVEKERVAKAKAAQRKAEEGERQKLAEEEEAKRKAEAEAAKPAKGKQE